MTNYMNYSLQRVYQSKTGSRKISSFVVVVFIHLVVGAVLLSGLTRTYATLSKPSAIDILPPDTKPLQQPKKWIEQPVARYEVVVSVIPPPDFPINLPREATADTSQVGDSSTTQEILPTGGQSSEHSPPAITRAAEVACPNSREVQASMLYPAQARRSGIQGDVIARFVVGANGSIRDIAIISSTSQTLDRAVINAVAQFRCVGQGQDIVVEAPFSFKLHD